MSVNKVILIGNLGKDPEIRTLDNGNKVANFSIATTESYNDKASGKRVDQTEWHNIVIWGKLADIVEKYMKKGSSGYFEGKLQTKSYEKDGVTRYRTDVVCSQMTMLGGKKQEGQQAAPAVQQAEPVSGEMDDLPF
jgi:single-strand DNA-binding protein